MPALAATDDTPDDTPPPLTLAQPSQPANLRLALPKGRIQAGVYALLAEASVPVAGSPRSYRPGVAFEGMRAKLLKPQNIVEMLHGGSRDVGFAGADWVAELQADVVELLDTALDPVRIVAAAPDALLQDGALPAGPLVVASEYQRLTLDWIERRGLKARFVRSYGATEVFPPEDADCIVDNSATGSTLRDNQLTIVDELMRSTTRLYASPAAMRDRSKRARIEEWVVLLDSVLQARQRVMLEVNVPTAQLDSIIAVLPCMRQPTVAPLHGEDAFAVKAAVPRARLPKLIGQLKAGGGSDIVVSRLSQIVV